MMFHGVLAKYLTVFGVSVVLLTVVGVYSFDLGQDLNDAKCKLTIEKVLADEREKFKKLQYIKENVSDLNDDQFDQWLLDNGHAK